MAGRSNSVNAEVENLLKGLGLASVMISDQSGTNYNISNLYNGDFSYYSPRWYRDNRKVTELDDHYNFDTTVFIHNGCGVRLEFSIHEGYFNEEYKLHRAFILTSDLQELDVLDFDVRDNRVLTAQGWLYCRDLNFAPN